MPLMILKSALAALNVHITESLRIVVLQGFLAPAAYLLPQTWALAAADALSLPLLAFPTPGFMTYWSMRRLFGASRYRGFRLAWAWIARPFRDFVILKRVLYGREDVCSWRIVEKNAEEVTRLRERGQSFIVATAHFERAALLALLSPQVTPGAYVQVGHAAPRRLRSPYDLRMRIQYGTLLEALSTAWGRPVEFAYTNTGQSVARSLYERLRNGGSIVNIHLDAPWREHPTGSYCRPFAGWRLRSFATGAAQLAKLSGRPVVSCLYWRDADGTVFLQWGSPILHVDDEIETMNRLIDTLETAVGERPTQYMMDLGHDRRWNPVHSRWEHAAA
jgi:lauroyl/myristoyl acyltransferase